ncbi:MAG: hypothetical protein ACE5IJ_03665 [Thermoplasmata archaeon]
MTVEVSLGPPQVYSVLLTNERCIFFRSSGGSGLGAMLGGIAGALLAEAMAKEEKVGSEEVDADVLASHKKSISFPYHSLLRLRVKRFGRGYRMRLEYEKPNGKRRKLKGWIAPTSEYVKQKKQEGVARRDSFVEYVQKVRQVFEQAVPTDLSHRMEWLL